MTHLPTTEDNYESVTIDWICCEFTKALPGFFICHAQWPSCTASFSPIINAHFALKSYAQPEARGNMQKLMHIGEHQTFQVGQYATFRHFHKHLPAKQVHIHETCHCNNLQKL
jgi:hypothetical protein